MVNFAFVGRAVTLAIAATVGANAVLINLECDGKSVPQCSDDSTVPLPVLPQSPIIIGGSSSLMLPPVENEKSDAVPDKFANNIKNMIAQIHNHQGNEHLHPYHSSHLAEAPDSLLSERILFEGYPQVGAASEK
ncbi:hypothetical protein H4R34_001832 [Dimargaris verticillata]|uniref:Uncharacterized protein n=1 Tax=Dimargaris verticillata TaxID=2761393 RepID=A0A9W8E9X0_9FUNG|nr:hypothetical protein H4R34_001832 [Dimargaris verticillata]